MLALLSRFFGALLGSSSLLLLVELLLLDGLFFSVFFGARLSNGLHLLLLDLSNLVLLLLLSGLPSGLLGVLELMVVELGRRLNHFHGQDQVLVLLAVDLHVARALAVVDEATLDERNLNRRLVDILLPQLGKVQSVRVCLRFRLLEAAAIHAGVHAAN